MKVMIRRSPETGLVDSHPYMLALQGDLEDHGGMIAFNTRIDRITQVQGGWLPIAVARRFPCVLLHSLLLRV